MSHNKCLYCYKALPENAVGDFHEQCSLDFYQTAGNNDMHLKNFSMINMGDQWTISPAYDLLNVSIVNSLDTEELALTLEGKKRKLQWEHFVRLGTLLGLNNKQINGVAKRFLKNRPLAFQ